MPFRLKHLMLGFSILFGLGYSLPAFGQNDCEAGFTYTVSSCNFVNFLPDSVNSSWTYNWDFGDGSESTETSPGHYLISYGTGTTSFTVTLTVSGPDCDENSTTQIVMVDQVPDPSIIDVSGNDFIRCTAGALVIQNTSTTQSTNTNYLIEWGTAPNGNPMGSWEGANFNTLSKNYNLPGQYEIVVTVTG
jgi:hypothetical protein